jgi:tetrathionate reductase subunit B
LTGIVLNDRDRCIGCGACVEACPYGARYLNPVSGENRKVDKCDFCIELLAQGIQPFCVETCIANARIFGDLEDRTSEVARYIERGAVQLSSRQVNLNPNVFYYGRKKDIVLLQKTSIPQRKT